MSVLLGTPEYLHTVRAPEPPRLPKSGVLPCPVSRGDRGSSRVGGRRVWGLAGRSQQGQAKPIREILPRENLLAPRNAFQGWMVLSQCYSRRALPPRDRGRSGKDRPEAVANSGTSSAVIGCADDGCADSKELTAIA